MAYGRNDFDRDFASPADYEDGFRESDAVRGERMLRRQSPSERLKALAAQREREAEVGTGHGGPDGPDI